MKYKQIVFDIDGTLIDTEYAVLHSLQDTIRIVTGNTIELNELKFALGITGKDALGKLNITEGARPLAHDFAKQSVVCYTLCQCCRKNAVASVEGNGIFAAGKRAGICSRASRK